MDGRCTVNPGGPTGVRPAAEVAELVGQARTLLSRASELLVGISSRDEDAPALLAAVQSAESAVAVTTAVQMRAEVAFRAARIRAQREAGVPRTELGRGITEEIAVARRMSPGRCANQSALRRVIVDSLPRSLDLLERGEVTAWAVEEVAKAVITLDDEDREQVDADLAARLPEVTPRTAGSLARARAAELDQDAAIARMRREESERHVSIRPVSDAMVQLTAIMPMAAGIAAFAALDRAARTARAAGAEGTRGQHMADALFSRITGLQRPEECDVELQLLMTDQALLAGSGEVAWLDGHPVPGAIARRFALAPTPSSDAQGEAGNAVSSPEDPREAGRRFIRRLYTDPVTGRLRDADARRRSFTGHDRRLVEMAYQRCAMPWCEARIQHVHHVQGYAEGGPTTLENGVATCEHCNYLLEREGWTSRMVPTESGADETRGLADPSGGLADPSAQARAALGDLVMEVRTPTGRVHRCPPPPLRPFPAAMPEPAAHSPAASRPVTSPLGVSPRAASPQGVPPPGSPHPSSAYSPPGPPGRSNPVPALALPDHPERRSEPPADIPPEPRWDDVPDPGEAEMPEDPLSDADWERLVAALTLSEA